MVQHALDFDQPFFVGQADAVLDPMMDVGLGESPLSADLAARQFTAVASLATCWGLRCK